MSTAGDKVAVICPECNKRLLVPASSLGKQGRCPVCKAVFALEELYEAESVPSPANKDLWGSAANANSFGAPTNSPFANNSGDYQLQPPAYSQPQSAQEGFAALNNEYAAPQVNPGPSYSTTKTPAKGQFWESSLLGGIALMVIAAVWFFVGLAINRIFFYPLVLFIIGLVVMIKGLASGNIAG